MKKLKGERYLKEILFLNSFSLEDKDPRFTRLKPDLAIRLLSKGLFYIRAMPEARVNPYSVEVFLVIKSLAIQGNSYAVDTYSPPKIALIKRRCSNRQSKRKIFIFLYFQIICVILL